MNLVLIRFKRHRMPYMAGDVAGFFPDIAKRYIAEGMAEYVHEKDKPVALTVEAAISTEEANEETPKSVAEPIVKRKESKFGKKG